jgi:hypothetical protein
MLFIDKCQILNLPVEVSSFAGSLDTSYIQSATHAALDLYLDLLFSKQKETTQLKAKIANASEHWLLIRSAASADDLVNISNNIGTFIG